MKSLLDIIRNNRECYGPGQGDNRTESEALTHELSNGDESRLSYTEILGQILQFDISSLNQNDIQKLMLFIHQIKPHSKNQEKKEIIIKQKQEITEALAKVFADYFIPINNIDRENIEEENIEEEKDGITKRGCGLLYLSQYTPQYLSVDLLLSEIVLREKHPRIWIDCMKFYSQTLVLQEIEKLLKNDLEENWENILIRLSILKEIFSEENMKKFLTCISEYLLGTKQEESFYCWVQILKLPFQGEIPAKFVRK